MGKAVTVPDADRLTRFRTIYKKRLEALRAANNDALFDVDHFLNNMVNGDELMRVADSLAFYPKLKSMILSLVLLSPSMMATNLKLMLSEFQLSVFCAIEKFMTTRNLTALHLLPEVAQHYKAYYQVKLALWQKFGTTGWRYVKLIDPAVQATAATNFPHLALAARAWVAAQPDCATFSQVQGKTIPPLYVKKAKIAVPEKYIKDNPTNLTAIVEAMALVGMNLDYQAFTPAEWRKIVEAENE